MLLKQLGFTLIAVLTLALGIGATSVMAQTPSVALKPGDAAPEIKLEKLLQAPLGTTTDWKSLKSKIVVVEFWATWCSPCMPALAHLNALADQFKDKPVQFLAITDEDDEAMLTQFLRQKPIRGWVGVNLGAAVFKAFDVIGRPHTVVVDQNGKIAAITEARNITLAVMNDLLAGKQINLPVKQGVAEDLEWDKAATADQSEPLLQVIIKPSNAITGGLRPQPGRVTADGVSLLGMITWAYEMPLARVVSLLPASAQPYKLSVVTPPGREALLHPLTQQVLEATFGFKTRRELREMEVLVLSVAEGKGNLLQPSQAEKELAMFARGWLQGQRQPLEKLAQLLGSILNKTVVDETGLKEKYDWDLPYNRASMQVLETALREQLGLVLTKANRSIEVLVVEKAEPAKRGQ